MAFCLGYAERAFQEGFPALVVLGGDKHVGPPRCVEHAWQLRQAIRAHVPSVIRAFSEAWDLTFRHGVCDHRIKELCRVYVSKSIDCEY